MVDVDHFKLLNDAHGHVAGDDVLRRVAGQLREACREQDTIARYGGEEFGIVLPNTDAGEALVMADRIRRLVAEAQEEPSVTISIGVATFPQDAIEVHELVTRRRRGPLPLQARRTRPGHGRRPAGRRRPGLATAR